MFNGFRLPPLALNQAERDSTTNRHTGLYPMAAIPEGRINSVLPATRCRYYMILAVFAAGAMRRFCRFQAMKIISMPGHAIPVRRGRAIVAVRTGQTSITTVIQVAAAPRGTETGIAGRIKRSHTPPHCSKNAGSVSQQKPDIPLRGGRAPSMSRAEAAHIHPRLLPEPASRGTPFQAAEDGPVLPFAQGKPARPPSRLPPRHGARRPASPGE